MKVLISFLISLNASAFILISDNYRLANPEETFINVNDDGCTASNLTGGDLLSYVGESIERFWNTVPESNLQFEVGTHVQTGMNPEEIPSGTIIVGCSDLGANAASGVTNTFEQYGTARIYINVNDPSSWEQSSREAIVNLIVHEIGHAVGLHHSNDPASVMTYSTEANWGFRPLHLSRDDKDGVIYLYPKEEEAGGLLGSCGTININHDDDQNRTLSPTIGAFLFQFLLGIFLIFLFKSCFRGYRTFQL